jgi:chorismate dehydratase
VTDRIRVGTVAYLNAAPLTAALDPARFEVTAELPRHVAERLSRGDVDVALVPVAAALTDADLRIVPGVCIGADGPVGSVVLAAETPPEAWTTVVLDGSSRTSITLAQLLLTQGPLATRVRADLTLQTCAPGDAPRHIRGTTAAVVIGDPARTLPAHLQRHDLAELWRAWTGLPFVFAVWAGRPDLAEDVQRALVAAGRQGVATIAERHSGEDLGYLTNNLRYTFDERALIGLRRYAALAHAAGLVGTADVQLYGPTTRTAPWDPEVSEALARHGRLDEPMWRRARTAGRPAELLAAANARVGPRTACTWWPVTSVALGEACPEPDPLRPATLTLTGSAWKDPEATTRQIAEATARGWPVGRLSLDGGPQDARFAAFVTAWRDAGLIAADVDPTGLDAAQREALAGLTGLLLRARLDATHDARLLAGLSAIHAQPKLWAEALVTLDVSAGALVAPGHSSPARWRHAIALTRLAVDVPVTPEACGLPLDAAQATLAGGADGLGPVDPKDAAEAERLIRAAGFEPLPRDAQRRPLDAAWTTARKIRPVHERLGGAPSA